LHQLAHLVASFKDIDYKEPKDNHEGLKGILVGLKEGNLMVDVL